MDQETRSQPAVARTASRDTARRALKGLRSPFFRTVTNDAARFCIARGEQPPTGSRATRLLATAVTVPRLLWQADDFYPLVLYRLRTSLFISSLPVVPRLLHFLCSRLSGVRIGDDVLLGEGVYFAHGEITIDGVVRIGRNASLFPWITIGPAEGSAVGPTLAEGVFVGTGAMILGNVTIGAHARVGANAVVLSDVPAGATAVGVPARIVESGRSDAK